MNENAVILINQEPKAIKKLVGILSCTGIKLNIFETSDQAEEYIKNLSKSEIKTIAIADYENRDFLEKCHILRPNISKIIIIDNQLDSVLNDIPDLTHIDSVVAKNYEVIAKPREVISTTNKIMSKDIFGLDKYLTWGFKEHSQKVYNSTKRNDVINIISDFAVLVSGRKPLGRIMADLIDELLMNAIFDANPKYATASRNQEIILTEEEAVTVKWGCDGHLFGVSVTDPFGNLKKDTVVSFLRKCFSKSDNMINYGEGGAGLGLYKILKSINSFIINVEEGRRTETIGIVDMSLSMKEFKAHARSFHFFST